MTPVNILVVLALACFVFGAFWPPAKVNVVSLGLALLTLAWMVARWL